MLLLALTVAVAALTGVGFLVSRISAAVALQASEVLAADIRLGSPQPLSDAYLRRRQPRRGVRTARSTTLLSVVFNGDASQLTNVAAVTAGYPLRGRLLVADGALRARAPRPLAFRPPAKSGRTRGCSPPSARTWARSSPSAPARCASRRVLIARPDQGSTFAELAPSLLMNAADLPATQLIQPGSRVSYAALFAGERDPDRGLQGLAHRPQAARASGCATSPRRARRCATPWTARAAS